MADLTATILGRRQVVRHGSLEPAFGGSNPPAPASILFVQEQGGMAERFKAAVLKTVDRKVRGFESLSLRQSTGKGDDVAHGMLLGA